MQAVATPTWAPIPQRRVTERSTLKVALVSTQCSWSGGESQAHLLAEGLRQRGHDIQIVTRQSGQFADQMRHHGFGVHTFSGRGRNPWGAWQLRRLLRRIAPHIVHMNDSHAVTSVGLSLLGTTRPACVASRRVDFPIRTVQRYQLWCDRVLCVSHAVASVCAKSGILPHRLLVVPDGCDPSRIEQGNRQRGRQSLRVTEHQRLILTVARLSDHKGHRYLLDAMPEVLARFPHTVLALAGDGELRMALERQAQMLDLHQHVRFLGHRRDIADLLHGADIFVMPSQLEGLCSSVIDAMLAEVPTVATTAGGLPDLLGPAADGPAVGILVPPQNGPALARGISAVLAQPEYFARLALQASDRARRFFTVDCMVDATLSAYRQVLQEKRALSRAA